MPSLQRIETDVAALPEDDLRHFRKWFDKFDSIRWDAAIESDIVNGKLDACAAEALASYGIGNCKPL